MKILELGHVCCKPSRSADESSIIGASLSEPHMNETAVRELYMEEEEVRTSVTHTKYIVRDSQIFRALQTA